MVKCRLLSFSSRHIVHFCVLSVFLSLVFITYAKKVDDLDLWWHLRSGQLLFQTKSIPQHDQMSFTTDLGNKIDEDFPYENGTVPPHFKHWNVNLSHSWLSQCIFYYCFDIGGLKGIAVLKSVVFCCTFLILYMAMLRAGSWPLLSILILTLVAYIGLDFNYSRPQFISFFLVALLLFLLIDFRNGGKALLLFPLIMAVWANLHGGFVMGIAILILYTSGSIVQFFFSRKFNVHFSGQLEKKHVVTLIVISSLSLILSLINPNGYTVYLVPLAIKQSMFFNLIEEYTSPMLYEYHGYWALFILTAFFLILRIRRIDIPLFFVTVFMAIASLNGIRVIIFFALCAGLVLSILVSDSFEWLRSRKYFHNLKQNKFVGYFSENHLFMWALAIFFSLLLGREIYFGEIIKADAGEYRYPTTAIEFIRKNQLPGEMFNNYNWGGYLTWKLPEYKTFIDGRCLSEKVHNHYQAIINAKDDRRIASDKSNNAKLWSKLLDQYGVQFILINAVSQSGHIIPLVDKLTTEPAWQLIYQDGKSLIFIRNTRENNKLFGQLYLPKYKNLIEEVILESLTGIQRTPSTWGYYETLGFIYMNKRELEKAKMMFEKYISINPNNARVNKGINAVRVMLGEKPLPFPETPKSPHHF